MIGSVSFYIPRFSHLSETYSYPDILQGRKNAFRYRPTFQPSPNKKLVVFILVFRTQAAFWRRYLNNSTLEVGKSGVSFHWSKANAQINGWKLYQKYIEATSFFEARTRSRWPSLLEVNQNSLSYKYNR